MPGQALSYARSVARIGVLALILGSALLGNLANLADLLRIAPAPDREMVRRDRRFETLRSSLPDRATLGYVTDSADPAESRLRLMLAQYSLAPLLLRPGADRALIVGDFSQSDVAAMGRELDLTLVRDFGNGVALFARPQR